MTPRIHALLDFTIARQQDQLRRDADWSSLLDRFSAEGIDDETRARIALEDMLHAEGENPGFLEGERIALTRTVRQVPALYTESEIEARRASGASFGGNGVVFNVAADFATTLRDGLGSRLGELRVRLAKARDEGDSEGELFCENALQSVQAVLSLSGKYRMAAKTLGLTELAEIFTRVPRFGARTLHEALQSLRILHFAACCEGEYRCGFGRIDQYLLPYYEADVAAGRIDDSAALELLEEFFVACNRDSDLYASGDCGGDRGQGFTLGGAKRDGTSACNALTRLCLKAYTELGLVDPVLNLRVDRSTPPEIFRLATELSAVGSGMPLYTSDEAVIPILERSGYDTPESRDYAVSGLWNFIVPGCGIDADNVDSVSFPEALDIALRNAAAAGGTPTYDAIEAGFFAEIQRRASALVEKYRHAKIAPGAFISVLSEGCVENARDISTGAKFNNFGIHAAGLREAVESLAAIRYLVFGKRIVTLPELVSLLETDFAGRPDILTEVQAAPKLGNSSDGRADGIAKRVMDFWSHAFDSKRNECGGIFRPGTDAATYALASIEEDATAEGATTPLQASQLPRALDFAAIANGGPLSVNLPAEALDKAEGVAKVAELVWQFVRRGGLQLRIRADRAAPDRAAPDRALP